MVLYNCQEERNRVVEDGFKKIFLKKKKFPLDKSHKICYNKIENKKEIKNLPKNFLKKFLKRS